MTGENHIAAAQNPAGLSRPDAYINAATQTCPNMQLVIGVFFDGTWNNYENSQQGYADRQSGIDDQGGSYAAGGTNVHKLYDLYKEGEQSKNACGGTDVHNLRAYVDGIGTRAREDDSRIGGATGYGSWGVDARVFETCLRLDTLINQISLNAEPREIILDVFGFSRGAAAARYFVNAFNAGEITWEKIGPLNDRRAIVPEGRNIKTRFLGVFDTVAALGLNANDAVNKDINIHLNQSSADHVVHLTANDEFRHNFSLNQVLPDGGLEISLPGSHGDVGGGMQETM